MKYDDPSATAGQFLLFLFIVIQALSELFSVWRYEGFMGFHREVDRRKRYAVSSSRYRIEIAYRRGSPSCAFTDWNDHLYYFFINNLSYPSSLNKNVFLWSAWQQLLSCLLKMLKEIWHFISARHFSAESYCESANKQAQKTWRQIHDLIG